MPHSLPATLSSSMWWKRCLTCIVVCFVSGFRSSNSWSDLLSATVHIVDDNPAFRTSTGRLLQACGYAVSLYESGEELLAQLPKDAGSNCILLDVRIPGLSGPELQVRLNDMGSHLPIVFLTGHGDISTTVQVIKAGAEDLLTKPIAKEELLAAIERAIARGRVRQEQEDKLETMRRLVNGLTPRE